MDDYRNVTGFSTAFGGLIYSDGCDLAHYITEVFTGELLTPDTQSAMVSDTIPSPVGEVGLGLFRYDGWGGDFWGHLGASVHGHSSAVAHRPSDGLSIVVLANIDPGHDNFETQMRMIRVLSGG